MIGLDGLDGLMDSLDGLMALVGMEFFFSVSFGFSIVLQLNMMEVRK
jgi:hypothetical protein